MGLCVCAPIIDHTPTNVKRYRSQSALQKVALETGGTTNEESGH